MSLTAWEAGNELVACADRLFEAEKDLREGGHADLADFIKDMRLTIGDRFNTLGSHEFGLAGHK